LPQGGKVAVLGTPPTAGASFYQKRLEKSHFEGVRLPEPLLWNALLHSIARVKLGDQAGAAAHLVEIKAFLEEHEVGAALLACSELPLAFSG
jgi:aspartate racemase